MEEEFVLVYWEEEKELSKFQDFRNNIQRVTNSALKELYGSCILVKKEWLSKARESLSFEGNELDIFKEEN